MFNLKRVGSIEKLCLTTDCRIVQKAVAVCKANRIIVSRLMLRGQAEISQDRRRPSFMIEIDPLGKAAESFIRITHDVLPEYLCCTEEVFDHAVLLGGIGCDVTLSDAIPFG